ncbi:MAG: polysaccharide deacetylase family protein, partial [bacterium]|nr:polysaccharide deacetylase family protein [bacterium]
TKKVTTNPTILYKNNEEKINIKEKLEFDVLYSDSDYIYVYFMNDIYGIKDNYEIVESKNEKLDSISFISLGSDLSNENLKQYLDYLNTNNYNTITIDEFNNWKNSYIDFPLNTILLIDEGSHTDLLNECNYKYELLSDLSKYNITNDIYKIKKTDKNYYKYVINNDTTMDDFINAINGIKDSKNQEIAVLNYHFFYEEKGICNESICLDMDIFRDELKYLNDNNYKTLTIDEFVDWYYGKISLPDNSVLLTIDDGAYGTSKINGNFLIPALEEYDLHATLFLITSWWDIENYRSNNLDIQSHGNDIHFESSCGYQIKCLKYDELLSDFKKSLDIVKSNTSFCFPFYVYTNNAISALEELDFKVAFVGGNKKASRSNNKYKIPRYVILDGISMNEFIGMIS